MKWIKVWNILLPNEHTMQICASAEKCINQECPHAWHVQLSTMICDSLYGTIVNDCVTLKEASDAIDRISFEDITQIALELYNAFYKDADDAIRKAAGRN